MTDPHVTILVTAAYLLAVALSPVTVVAQSTQPADGAGQPGVPVQAVVLYSSGVGYFEHFGTVAGDASTELRFKTAQINDILKSLVLQDLDGGRVSTITYPSQDPVEKTLHSFQVNISGNPPLGDLLTQLRGAKVTVSYGAEPVEGTILGVEKKPRPVGKGDDAKVVEVTVLNLITRGAIRAIPLDEVRSIALDDPALQAELDKALAALAQSRDQDKKPVAIHFTGQGERRVRLGYVIETPVWKTSYRLVMGERPKLQGWAIVENQTDNDWTDVQLSLVSGRPISFVQDLYQPLYIPRPVVQNELYASLRPQTYEGGMGGGGAGAMADAAAKSDKEMQAVRAKTRFRDGPPAAAAPHEAQQMSQLRASLDPTASVSSVASAAQMGELFEYTVGNVSLPRQKSAMIPIVTDDVEVERLSIYNANVLAKFPLNGARLKNTTGKHLLQGPITVFDANAYAGDARIDNVPPSQERLLSYGIDLQLPVNSTHNTQQATIQSGKIVKGVLHITRKHVFNQDYVAENKADKDKTLVVEHPLRAGWKLMQPDKPMEKTEALYRFKLPVAPGKTEKLTVQEEIVQGEAIAILPADIGQVDFYSRTGEIPKDVRDALAEAVKRKSALVDTQRQIEQRQQRIAQITTEQNRIRENMRTVTQNSDYYNRLLKKLNEQESQLETLQTEVEQLHEQMNQRRQELEAYLQGLNVG